MGGGIDEIIEVYGDGILSIFGVVVGFTLFVAFLFQYHELVNNILNSIFI